MKILDLNRNLRNNEKIRKTTTNHKIIFIVIFILIQDAFKYRIGVVISIVPWETNLILYILIVSYEYRELFSFNKKLKSILLAAAKK